MEIMLEPTVKLSGNHEASRRCKSDVSFNGDFMKDFHGKKKPDQERLIHLLRSQVESEG